MNIKLGAENDFLMMQEFFQSGGTLDAMPEELRRVRLIWKRADDILRQFPYYSNEKIANQLRADLPEYDLSPRLARLHVTNAKKYYDFAEGESPETHQRLLTEICYQQIAVLKKHQLNFPSKAHITGKSIEAWVNRIASINSLYDKKEQKSEDTGDLFLILSSDDMKFPDIPNVTEKELYSVIEDVTQSVEITEAEKQKIISKDVKNNIL